MAPGRKTGGRKAGTPNKLTSRRVEEVARSGKPPPAENLRIIANNAMAMAARYQPELTDPQTKEKQPNPEYNEERYAYWLSAAREANRDAAPYFTPKLAAIAMAGALTVDQQRSDKIIDPRQKMLELYLGMRRRGQLTAKVINPPKKKTDDAEPPDDGDGVAV